MYPWFIHDLRAEKEGCTLTRCLLISFFIRFFFPPFGTSKTIFIASKQPSILFCFMFNRHAHFGPFSETIKCTKAWHSSCMLHQCCVGGSGLHARSSFILMYREESGMALLECSVCCFKEKQWALSSTLVLVLCHVQTASLN